MPINDLFTLLGSIKSATLTPPESIGRTEVGGGIIISTVISYDFGPETAILTKDGTYPVERYTNRVTAQAGHEKWVKWASDKNNKQFTRLGYGSLVDEEEIILTREED